MPTFYDTLGVSRHAALDEIKQAHRKIVLSNHSDKTVHLSVAEQQIRDEITKAANNAWDTLRDSDKRAEYDKTTFPAEHWPNNFSQQANTKPSESHKREYEFDFGGPSYTPPPNHCGPAPSVYPRGEPYPNQYSFIRSDWSFDVKIAAHYKVLCWGSNRLWVDGHRVMFYAQIERIIRPDSVSDIRDIEISVKPTPGDYKVSRIESMFTHRGNVAGSIESTLIVTLEAPPERGSKRSTLEPWNWAWNLGVAPPPNTALPVLSQCWIELQKFYVEEQKWSLGNPSPGYIVSKRGELQPCAVVDLGVEKRRIVSGGRNNPTEVMYRYAALGFRRVKMSFGKDANV